MGMGNRVRRIDVDPVVVLFAALMTVVAVVLGEGIWAVAVGGASLAVPFLVRRILAGLARRSALPPAGSPERALVLRARAAATSMERISALVPDGPVAERCREMVRSARVALPTIRDLGVQSAYVMSLAAGVPVEQLELEREQTAQQLASDPQGRVRLELESSMRSSELQLATARRLRALSGELAARTRALTISIEAVAAGLTELLAMSSSDPNGQPLPTLTALSAEIEALRGGLEEAQDFGRQAAAIHFLEELT